MSIQLLQWGLFSFMIGMVLSLPLAAVHYQKHSPLKKFFINTRKLKSAHLDYFMQTFSIGFAYLLEHTLKTEFPLFVVIPLIFGVMMNPTILLFESTPFVRSKEGRWLHLVLRATSPVSLLFSWTYILFLFLPILIKILFLGIIVALICLFFNYRQKPIKMKVIKNS